MAREVASKWIIGIVIYFIVLGLIFTVIGSISSEYELDTLNNLSASGGSNDFISLSIGECTSPRFYNLDVSVGINNERNIKYSALTELGYITDPNTCESFVGAEWGQKTFLTIPYGDEICLGVINLTHYNNNVFFSDVNMFDFISNTSLSVCDLSLLENDQYTCETFGCNYITALNKEDISGVINSKNPFTIFSSITKTIIDVTTLRINFGFSEPLLNGFLTFLFIWVPIMLLILSIYVMIR